MADVFSLPKIIKQLQTQWADGDSTPRSWIGSTIEYSFLEGVAPFPIAELAGLTDMTANQKAWADEAFELWDDLIAINLTNTNDASSSQISFGYSSTTDDGGTYATVGTVPLFGTITGVQLWMSTGPTWDELQSGNLGYGKRGLEVFLHEIGHALGLSHPGSYNAGDDPEPTYAADAEYVQDSLEYTIMSYFDAVETSPSIDRFGSAGNFTYVSTPLLHDIAAIQAKYGADFTTRAADTVYGFNFTADRSVYNFQINIDPIIAIWDGGGIDTIDCSGYNQDQFINLEAGSYSDVGALTKNVAIAFNCIIENAVGGSGKDLLSGNVVNNRLEGGNGNDGLLGEFGNDILIGGRGNDKLRGGDGNDTLTGGVGGDVLDGGRDFDIAVYDASIGEVIRITPTAGAGNWTVVGAAQAAGDGLTKIEGFAFGNGGDMITIANSTDMRLVSIDGNGGNDIITGNAFNETMIGGAGSDFFRPNEGSFSVFGGTAGSVPGVWIESLDDNDQLFLDRRSFGADYILFDNGISPLGSWSGTDNSTARGIAVIRYLGSDFSDRVTGALRDDVLRGFGGADFFNGRSGNDELDGGDGADFIEGGEGDDNLQGGLGFDTLDGGDGNDRIETGGGGDIRVFAGAGNDELIGSEDAETMNGGSEQDTIRGFGGNDNLYGDAGNDVILAGAGNDFIDPGLGFERIDGGQNYDILVIHRETTTLGVTFFLNGATGNDGTSTQNIEELFYWGGSGADQINGGAGTDNIWGGVGKDVLSGGAGADFLAGGDNDDTLRGGLGADTFEGGAGNDRIETGGGGDVKVFGEAGNDLLIGSDDIEILQGGGDNDIIRAFGGNDQLWGDAGNDLLLGGLGNDLLNGGLDSDTFQFSSGVGSDTVMDFDSDAAGGQDTIDVTAFGFAGFAAMLASGVTIVSSLGSTVINFGAGRPVVTLSNVNSTFIDASDFFF